MPVETPPIQIDGDPLQLRWRGPCPVRCGGRGLREPLPGGGVKIYCDSCDHYAIFRADGSMIPPVAPDDLPRQVTETCDALGGAGGCRIDGCGRMASGATGLCTVDRDRWRNAGQPELHAWIAAGAPSKTGRPSKHKRVLCATPGCTMPIFCASDEYGTERNRYCGRCRPYQDDAPPNDTSPPPSKPKETKTMAAPRTQPQFCRVPACGKSTQARGLCRSHYRRWHGAGKPDVERFIRDQPAGPPRQGRKRAKPLPPPPPEEKTQPLAAPKSGGNSTACDDQFAPEPPATPPRVTASATPAPPGELIMRPPDASGRIPLIGPINRIGAVDLSRDVDAIRVLMIGGNWLTITDDTGRVLRQIELAHEQADDGEAAA